MGQSVVVEVLSQNLARIKLCDKGPILSHTFFANNALSFMNNANPRKCQRLADVLYLYCHTSRQLANLQNPVGLIFCRSTLDEVKEAKSNILGIPIEEQGF